MTPSPPQSARRPLVRIGAWLYEERWLIALFLAALAVRLHWNLEVHPPGDYIYSDMNGYVSRADRLLRAPTKPHEYSAFFPFGTHWVIAGCKWLFGKENYDAVGILFALLGATCVALTYSVARRAAIHRIVAPAAGLLAVVYYPHFSLGGYILSEMPFSACLMAALLFALRLADHGRHRDAWFMGLAAGFGALFRPQLLLSAAAVGVFWIARRRSLPNIKLKHLLQSAVPLLLLLGVANYHFRYNTSRRGLVSENGTFNLVFARCHNSKIMSLPDGKGHGKVHFRPPPFLQLNSRMKKAHKEGKEPQRILDPALQDELSYKGYIGDRDQHMNYIRKCMRKTGVLGQLSYTYTNVSLLWRWNIPWPDSGKGAWRAPASWWSLQAKVWLAIPALLCMVSIVVPGRRAAKLGIVAVNLLALLVLAGIFFGGARHRAPYDFIVIILAFQTYAFAAPLVVRLGIKGLQRLDRVARQMARPPSSS